jgi:murein tripeptide amidase MpaA
MTARLQYDHFYRHDELGAFLHALAAEFPTLLAVESIGVSFQGREIWLATVTNTATGRHCDKPALWLEANVHATELTGSHAALHLVERLVTGHGHDERVTRVLDTRCFYVVARLNPDGAERMMQGGAGAIRSSVRPYPHLDQRDGLIEGDVDGDGRVLTMRVADPNGAWVAHADDPRLLVLRDPEDDGVGTPGGDGRVSYRLLPEGTIQNYDGALIPLAPDLHGLDLNRNYPMEWRPEGDQSGAGPYPTSEPEIAAEVAAITERRNITAFVAYHTYGGLYLRPYSAHADDTMPTADLRAYTKIGRTATELTGYPALSVFHDFLYHPKQVETGASDDWAYDHLGMFAWTVEIWSPMRQAGITEYKPIEWFREHPVADDLAIMRWNDEALGAEGFVDWYPFEHPQLGPVELGGFPLIQPWSNPPFSKLEAEIAPHAEMMIHHLLISPLLRLRSAEAVALGPGVWKVRVVIENAGWLPTNVTEKAVERKAVRPVEAEIALPDGVELVSGDQRVELGQLAGRVAKTTPMDALSGTVDPTKDRAKAEWIVRCPGEGPPVAVNVTIRHDRAGLVRTTLLLGT